MIEIVAATSEAQWGALVDTMAGSTAFHRWRWLELQCQVQGWRQERLVLLDGPRTVGVVPLILTRRGPFWVQAPTPFPYVGPLVPREALPAALASLARWSRRHGVLMNRLDFAPQAPCPEQALRVAHCSWEQGDTYVIDLSHGDEDVWWRQGHRNLGNNFRKALRSGVTIQPATESEVTTCLPALMDEAYRAHGASSPYPASIGAAVWRAYAGGQDAFIGSARREGETAGVLVGFAQADTVYSWAGGGFRSQRAHNPNIALHVELVRWALSRGAQRVDLCGGVDAAVARFKEGLGAHRETFLMATQMNYPLTNRLRHARDAITARRHRRSVADA